MEKKIIKHRWWIIGLSLAVTLGFSSLLFRIEIDPDLRHYFPETMTSMVNTERIEEVFGNQELVMIIFETDEVLKKETLTRVRDVEKEISRMDGVRRTSSLFGSNRIHGEEGIMYVEPTIRRIPGNVQQMEELREVIQDNDLVYKVVVSEDFTATAIVATLEKEVNEEELFAGLETILQEHEGEEKVHFGGLPYLRQAIDHDIKRDGLILIPFALVLMLIFLYLVFREWRGVWLPFLVVVMSALVALALIPILGWKFYVITLLVPILLIAVANDYGIHMIAKYQELNASGNGHSMKEISRRITRALWRPILLTGLTTIAGVSALLAHTMIPARQMALVAGVGIALAIFFSLVLLPALLSLLQRSAPRASLERPGVAHRQNFLGRFALQIVNHRKPIPWVALGVTLLVSTGIIFLRVDSNEENFFPERHEVKQAAKIINSKFGGSENISVMFAGDMMDPAMLERMEEYRKEMEGFDAVDLTMAFSGVIREISKALNDPGDPLYDRIPDTRQAVAQYMELYSMSGNPEDLEQLVDFNYEHAHLVVRINDANNETVNGIITRLEEMSEDDPSVAAIGGYGYVRTELANKVLQGTFTSLGIALLIIFLLVSLIFRSFSAGMLGIMPISVSVLILFGLMGLTGVRLDVATALLSSVMIGVGVDYTIHFLWRYREELQKYKPPREAAITTISTTGRGIIFNALSVIVGFSVLIISSFTPIRFFGILVVVSILSCLIGAMVILPAMVLRFRFQFLEGAEETEKVAAKRPVTEKGRQLGDLGRIAMIALMAGSLFGTAAAQDPVEIVRKSHDAVKISSFEAISTLTINDSRGNTRVRKNTMASLSLSDGTEKRIIKFLEPAEVRGTGILIFDYEEKSDDMWIYLPALRKTRRIVSRERSNSFMGSEFSNADMTAPNVDDFDYTFLGEEQLDGEPCYRISATPKTTDLEDEYGYSRSERWVSKNNYLVHRTRYYDFDGELFKTIRNEEFRELDREHDRYMVTHMLAENHENGRSSEMVMNRIALTSPDESYFTVAYLEKE